MSNLTAIPAPKTDRLAPVTRRQVADAFYQLRDAGVRIVYVPIFEKLGPATDAVLIRWQDDGAETDLFIAADLPRAVTLSVLEQSWNLLLAPELCRWIEHDGADGPSLQTIFRRTDGSSSESRTRG